MVANTDFNPNWASNPGETISDILNRKKVPVSEFASTLQMSISDVKKLLHGFIPISDEIAEKLSKSVGGSVSFWVQLQNLYDHYTKKIQPIEEQRWLKELPINEMKKNGWIDPSVSLLNSCLNFFNVPDIWTWRKKYSDITALALFRKSAKLQSTAASIATWIRQAEKQTEKLQLKEWNPQLFRSNLTEIKKLTRQKDLFSFIEKLRSICSECGVALAIVQNPPGCSASGAAKFLDNGNGLIILSMRYGYDDHFWFTFFHEAGHLLLHGEKETFVDEEIKQVSDKNEEQEANDFALEILLPGDLQNELLGLNVSDRSIRVIANKAGVSLGIIVGQLQFFKKIPQRYYNGFKRKIDREKVFQKIN